VLLTIGILVAVSPITPKRGSGKTWCSESGVGRCYSWRTWVQQHWAELWTRADHPYGCWCDLCHAFGRWMGNQM